MKIKSEWSNGVLNEVLKNLISLYFSPSNFAKIILLDFIMPPYHSECDSHQTNLNRKGLYRRGKCISFIC